jgi:hypothetical protein
MPRFVIGVKYTELISKPILETMGVTGAYEENLLM